MIAVRTPLGKLDHLASSVESERTFCGLMFSPGFDSTRELRGEEMLEKLCANCGAVNRRRMQRNNEGFA